MMPSALVPDRVWLLAGGEPVDPFGDPDDCNVYAVETGTGVILIDAGVGREPQRIVDALTHLGIDPERVVALLLTHTHLDHSGGAAFLRESLKLDVHASTEAVRRLRDADEDAIALTAARAVGIYRPDDHLEAVEAHALHDGDTLTWGQTTVRAIATPGHASDHLAFLIDLGSERILCSGDLIFSRGRIHLLSTPDSSLQGLIRSVNSLRGLVFTMLLPGHFDPIVPPGSATAHIADAHSRLDQLAIPRVVED
jgi:hydroxyacylglutathione hydrolase